MTNHNSTPRLGLYARISTKNNGQDPETQLVALRGYATARGGLASISFGTPTLGVSCSRSRPQNLQTIASS